jgi:hypothetical protein
MAMYWKVNTDERPIALPILGPEKERASDKHDPLHHILPAPEQRGPQAFPLNAIRRVPPSVKINQRQRHQNNVVRFTVTRW